MLCNIILWRLNSHEIYNYLLLLFWFCLDKKVYNFNTGHNMKTIIDFKLFY